MKKILLFIFICLNLLAYKNSYTDEYKKNILELKKNLYVVEGKGKYLGYLELKGFGNDKPYRIYFMEDDYGSRDVREYSDERTNYLNEKLTWSYKGQTSKLSRKSLYEIFDELDTYSDNAQDLVLKKYEVEYRKWEFDQENFYNDMNQLIDIYLNAKEEKNEWISEITLKNKYNLELDTYSQEQILEIVRASNSNRILLEIHNFNSNFVGEKEFDGIKIKIKDEQLYFSRKSLEEKKLILTKKELDIYDTLSDEEKEKIKFQQEEEDENWIKELNLKQEEKKRLEKEKIENERKKKLEEEKLAFEKEKLEEEKFWKDLNENWLSPTNFISSKYSVGFNQFSKYGFYKKSNENDMFGSELVYPMPNFEKSKKDGDYLIDGLNVRYYNNKAYFNIKELKEKGILE